MGEQEQRIDEAALGARLAGGIGAARRLVAIIGAPGSGKTTFAGRLRQRIEAEAPGSVVALGMDGFHLDDGLLEARGWRARKGAPHTFDVGGLKALLARLRDDREEEILAPVFDRSLEIARAGALAIPRSARVVLVEGNYLLLDAEPWRALRAFFDLTVRLDAPLPALRERLMARWRGHGFSEEDARAKVEANDLPNAERILRDSAPADLVVSTAGAAPSPIA